MAEATTTSFSVTAATPDSVIIWATKERAWASQGLEDQKLSEATCDPGGWGEVGWGGWGWGGGFRAAVRGHWVAEQLLRGSRASQGADSQTLVGHPRSLWVGRG